MKTNRLVVSWLSKTPIGQVAVTNRYGKILLPAILSLCSNSLYALYHGILGVLQMSLWFVAMCAFYGILAVMRFEAVLCGRKADNDDSTASEYFVMKVSGILLLLLSMVMAWVNSISISQNIATAYDKITMITIATYTFSKITAAIIKAIRQRGGNSPLFAVYRNIRYAEVAASVLTLQRSMLVSFGSMGEDRIRMMNALTGAAVCLLILILGILMIIKSRKEYV